MQRKIRIDNPTSWPHHRSGWGPCAGRLQEELGTPGGTLCVDSEDRIRSAYRRGGIHEPFLLISHYVPFGHPRHPGWNLVDFAKDRAWLACRRYCLGVVALSRYASEHARRLLGVPCDWVLHATEPASAGFSMDHFLSSPARSLVMVGWWMRRFRTFCELEAPGYVKRLLPGVCNRRSIEKVLESEGCLEAARGYLAPRLSAPAYDELLSRSVVYLDLFDASANNAVIECIARRTPILVRRLPAVVEYLGEGYPYYFHSADNAQEKLRDVDLICQAHRYLEREAIQARIRLATFSARFAQTQLYEHLGC